MKETHKSLQGLDIHIQILGSNIQDPEVDFQGVEFIRDF